MVKPVLQPLSIKPIVSYPSEAQIGKTYLLTIDLEWSEGFWNFSDEEYIVYCQIDSEPYFKSCFIDKGVITLHRFGGSYGPAKVLLTANSESLNGLLKISFINQWGVPISKTTIKGIKIQAFSEKTNLLEDVSTEEYDNVFSPKFINFESLIEAATVGLAGFISGLVKEKGIDTLKRLNLDVGKSVAFKGALTKYVQHYIERHGTFKVICVRMDEAIRLDKIYTSVKLMERDAAQYYESAESLEKLFQKSSHRNLDLTETERKIGIQIANTHQYLMVLGGPGVGKSTFLRKIGLEALKTLGQQVSAQQVPEKNASTLKDVLYQHSCIPVMLELRQFNQLDFSIEAKIAEELEICGFPHSQEFTELLLKNGKLLLLLDGLNEVSSAAFNHIVMEIEKLVSRYSDNRFIISCRLAAYTFGGFIRFKDVTIAAFDDAQIEQFIKNWFRKPRDIETEAAQRYWALLNSPEYAAVKELARTPLLLILICVIYDQIQDFPKNQSALYGEALDVLLRNWNSEKRINQKPIYQELSADLELGLLSEIAYQGFANNQLFLSKAILVKQIRDFLMANLNAPNHLDIEGILQRIEIQQGILVERARNTYSFSHLIFQEYLTAQYIVDCQQIDALVDNYLFHKRWHQVFLIVSGLVRGRRGTNDLLLMMEKQSNNLLQTKKIQELIDWIESIVNPSSENLSVSAKRLISLYLVVFLGVSPEYARETTHKLAPLFDIDSELLRAIDYSMFPDLNLVQLLEDRSIFQKVDFSTLKSRLQELELGISTTQNLPGKSWSQELESTFIQAFRIPSDCITLSQKDQSSVKSYVEAYELIFRCKQAAVRVSLDCWSGITERFLSIRAIPSESA